MSRKPSLLLATLVFCIACLPSLGQQSAKGKAAETATLQLLQMHRNYQQASAPQRTQLLTQFTTLAAQRQQTLLSLMHTNPGDVLRIAIPNSVSRTMPAPVQDFVEKDTIAQGVLEVLVEMNGTPAHTTGTKMHYGLATAQQRLELHFASNPPQHLLTGSVVRVHGVQVGSDLALASGSAQGGSASSVQTVSAASLPNTFGQTNTLAILVNFQDNTAQPETPSSVQDAIFNQTSNWDMENSFQQTWLAGAVAGWFTIPLKEGTSSCDTTFTNTVKSDAKSAAQSAGFNLSSYTHFIYVMPATPCTWWGYASIGGGDVWISGNYGVTPKVVSHEMGHNFGLYHSHTMDCGTAVTCSSGTLNEYGDWIDTMGASQAGHYNSFQKERLGWLNNGAQPSITTVTSSGTYQLSPYEVRDSYPKALKILQSSSSNSYYYVEYRQAVGEDSFLSSHSDVLGGVLVHLASTSDANSSHLLDMTPTSPSSFTVAALITGQSYIDSSTGITITPLSTGAMAAVQITMNGPACTLANPSVSISPSQSQWVTSGSSVNFGVTVKSNDSSTCPSSTFDLGDTLPSGWTGTWSTSALTLTPGSSGSATVTVASPSGTADGFYNVGVTAANSSTASYSGSVAATYVISTPLPVSINVSTKQSNYLPGQIVTVNVTMLSGTSPDAGASVSVSIVPPNGKKTTLNGTTSSNGVASMNYKLQKRAPAGTYGVDAAPASTTGASATMAATTTFVVQ